MQYSEFAYVYDRLMHEDIDYEKWCDYIENLFDLHGSEVDSICELACGTGNMTSILERRGYKMTASDISKDMLNIAREKLSRTKLICSDMNFTNPRFVVLTSKSSSFSHLQRIN